MGLEVEVKFLDVNVRALRKNLEDIGAKRVHKTLLFRRYLFFLPTQEKGFVRIRDEVTKRTLTVKKYREDTKYADEYEVEFSGSLDDAKNLLLALGLKQKSYQETLREKWIVQNCSEIVIDTVPGIPTYVEIECNDESVVKLVSKKLGLDFSKGKYGAFDQQYLDYYSVPKDVINQVLPQISFLSVLKDLEPHVQKNKPLLEKVYQKQLKKYERAKRRSSTWNLKPS